MAGRGDIYGLINDEGDMSRVFESIRHKVAVESRSILTELYRRAGYLITLTYAPSWVEKFGLQEAHQLRGVAEKEFRSTARLINRRAGQIGTAADYHESWGADFPNLETNT